MSVTLDTRRLDMIINRLPRESERLVRAGASQVMAAATAKAPIDTGALASSIHVEKKQPLLCWVGDGVEYGIYQELGTSRMSAQPFMTPAVEATRDAYNASWRSLFSML